MKLKYLAAVAVLALSLSSCNSFLDKNPDTRVELETIEQLRELLVNGYPQVNYANIGELSSDNVVDNNSPSDEGVRYNLAEYKVSDNELYTWQDVTLETDDDTPSYIWQYSYYAIAVANAVLEKVPQFEAQNLSAADSVKLSEIKGEALLIRAYNHFVLAQIFCMPYRGPQLSKNYPGVPYITTPETKVTVHYDRGTLEETYEKIEADLLEGLPLINDELYEVPKFHFNRTAANAFAARFYLFKREYDKTLQYANAAFNGTDPATMMNDVWSQSGFYYISDINRYYNSVNRQGNFLIFATSSTYWRHIVSSARYATNRDAKRATIQGPGPSWQNCRYRNTRTNETFAMNPCFRSVCGVARDQEYGTYFAGTCGEQFEYTDKNAGIGYVHMMYSAFTAEETLLCRAEAKLFLGDTEGCVADLKIWDDARQKNLDNGQNQVPLTASLIESFYNGNPGFGIVKPIHVDEVCPSDKYHLTEAMVPYEQCIQHYRRIQTVHTGMRWFDIKRLGLSITHKYGRDQSVTLQSLDPRYAIQIPVEVIAAGLEPTDRVTAPAVTNATVINTIVRDN